MSLLHDRRDAPLPPSEDVVIAQSLRDDDPELALAPPDGMTAEEATEALTGLPGYFEPGAAEEPQPQQSAFRFTLFEMFALTTFLCVEAGVASWFPLQVSVGIIGLCTLLVLLAIVWFAEPTSRLVKLGLVTLVSSYVVGAIVAIVRQFTG